MTQNQWRMLDILDCWGGQGTIEVEIQFGDYDFGDSEAGQSKGRRVCRLVVANLVKSLVRKGYATDDDNGYDITEAGRALLVKHQSKVQQG